MNNPTVSFVMPAFKADFLKQSIDSIVAQLRTDWELIVVDDCSPEDLYTIVREFNDPRISYYRNKTNIGGTDLVRQWNKSISYAKGVYIVLASDDDYYEPLYLTKLLNLAAVYQDVNIFRPRTRRINNQGIIINEENWMCIKSTRITLQEFLNYYTHDVILSAIPQYMFKRSALIQNGGFVNFPLGWFSDDATVAKLAINNGIVLCDEVLFTFRVWEKSISGQMSKQDTSRVRSKIDAGAFFVDFINQLPIEVDLKLRLLNRARLQSYWQVAFGSFGSFLHGLIYMYRKRNDVYTLSWCAKHLIKNILMRIS